MVLLPFAITSCKRLHEMITALIRLLIVSMGINPCHLSQMAAVDWVYGQNARLPYPRAREFESTSHYNDIDAGLHPQRRYPGLAC